MQKSKQENRKYVVSTFSTVVYIRSERHQETFCTPYKRQLVKLFCKSFRNPSPSAHFLEPLCTVFILPKTLLTVAAVMLVVVVQEAGSAAFGTREVWPSARPDSLPRSRPRAVGGKLMTAHPAKILLIPVRIFAVTVKVMIVVAFRAAYTV